MGKLGKKLIQIVSRYQPLLRRAVFGLAFLVRVALGLIFIYSSMNKIAHPQDFLASVYDFRITGPTLGLIVAIALPWFELLLGAVLVVGIFPGGALIATNALVAMFLIVQASAIARGLSVSCGCFGPDEGHLVGKVTLLRTSAIFLAALVAFLWHYRRSLTASPIK